MGQNSAKPQVMFFPALPGGPGGLGDQAVMALPKEHEHREKWHDKWHKINS